jgi:hypothetical protein
MQVLSLVWGILAILGMLVGFFPCLGALNWPNIPFAVVGLIISVITLVTVKGPSKGGAIAGVVLCGVAALLGLLRLAVGGGVL